MMRIQGEVKDATCTQVQLSRALGVSKQRVGQLIDEGVVIRDESSTTGQVMLFESLQNYFLSKNVSGDSVNFWKEKGLNERAKRRLNEIKVRKADGELYEAETVENAFIEMLTILRTNLLGLPSKMTPILEGKNRNEIFDLLTSEIESKLAAMSEYNANDYRMNVDLTAEGD